MKILKHLGILIVIAAIGAGAAYAYFVGTAKVKGATFSTGTATLQIAPNPDDESHWANEFSGINFSGIYPGWSDKYWVFVRNTGTTVLHLNLTGDLTSGGTNSCNLASQIRLGLENWSDNKASGITEGTISWSESLSYLLSQGANGIDLGLIKPFTLFEYPTTDNPAGSNFKIYILHFSLPTNFVLPEGNTNGCQLSGYDFVVTGTANPEIQPTPTTQP